MPNAKELRSANIKTGSTLVILSIFFFSLPVLQKPLKQQATSR